MGTLTKHRQPGRRQHLSLVPEIESTDVVRSIDDPEPGRRDIADVVSRFGALLPADDTYGGVFSLATL